MTKESFRQFAEAWTETDDVALTAVDSDGTRNTIEFDYIIKLAEAYDPHLAQLFTDLRDGVQDDLAEISDYIKSRLR